MISLLAQNPTPQSLGPLRGIGPLGLEGKEPTAGAGIFVNAISNIIGFLTAVAIIWFIFQFLLGAIGWISAGGDKGKLEQARSKLANAFVGIIIVFTALVLVSAVGALLGINILNFGKIICDLTPGGC